MTNQDIQAAWHYHNGTKHPDGYLMDRWHSFDPSVQPMLLKIYEDLDSIPLFIERSSGAVSALSAISTGIDPSAENEPLSITSLGKILQFSAGITKRITYPWGEMAFRAAACTGALYHIELYVVAGEIPGLEAGIYQFDPRETALKRLRPGDYRSVLVDASGDEPAITNAPAVIVFSDVRWRNACKYQAREYRHTFWDSGTILANTLAISTACGVPARVVAGFTDDSVNRLLDLDTEREVAVAMVPLGRSQGRAGPTPEAPPLSLETAPISDQEIVFPAIAEIHTASSMENKEEVVAWRSQQQVSPIAKPSGPLTPLLPVEASQLTQDAVESVIVRRGSARRFSHESISFQQLSTVLERATGPVPADFLAVPDASLNDVYLIVNAVDGLASGSYVFHRKSQELELLAEGDFRRHAGALGLHQDLPGDASVNVYLLSNLTQVLDGLGNRGYRAAQLEASIIAGRIYLAAYAQRLGATGLTFYDDGVTNFFSPHAEGKSVMFLVAIGKRAR